ncbi:MAG: HIT domain-containing protein [Euryhalocaulis sp.]|uniref:HIT domain-containing protein n=1 Tax=Euryhalocaulis sp. TaxID=2744307 RepID=UPI001823F0C7|nr:HIT family protein [Euryhalocaulis sp.]MBA4801391.1 HIT domain-containing protein [Euryhalocaulis sp.]
MSGFALDPRLEADSVFVADLGLSQLRLQNDARYVWCVLVPRREKLMELDDLSAEDRAALIEEAVAVGAAIRAIAPVDKINTGALGNIVRQLHVHVIGRREGDAAWPGPVWGHGAVEPYEAAVLEARITALRKAAA